MIIFNCVCRVYSSAYTTITEGVSVPMTSTNRYFHYNVNLTISNSYFCNVHLTSSTLGESCVLRPLSFRTTCHFPVLYNGVAELIARSLVENREPLLGFLRASLMPRCHAASAIATSLSHFVIANTIAIAIGQRKWAIRTVSTKR